MTGQKIPAIWVDVSPVDNGDFPLTCESSDGGTTFPPFRVCFCCSSAFLSNNVQMLIDAAPRAANNSHTASDAKGAVMMNEGPHRTPQKNIDHKATSSKKNGVCQTYPEVACGGFAFFVWKKKSPKRDFCRPSSNSQTHAVFLCIPWPQWSYELLATYHWSSQQYPIIAIANSEDHNPRRKEIKSSYNEEIKISHTLED